MSSPFCSHKLSYYYVSAAGCTPGNNCQRCTINNLQPNFVYGFKVFQRCNQTSLDTSDITIPGRKTLISDFCPSSSIICNDCLAIRPMSNVNITYIDYKNTSCVMCRAGYYALTRTYCQVLYLYSYCCIVT